MSENENELRMLRVIVMLDATRSGKAPCPYCHSLFIHSTDCEVRWCETRFSYLDQQEKTS